MINVKLTGCNKCTKLLVKQVVAFERLIRHILILGDIHDMAEGKQVFRLPFYCSGKAFSLFRPVLDYDES